METQFRLKSKMRPKYFDNAYHEPRTWIKNDGKCIKQWVFQ